MIRRGILKEGDAVELLEGILVKKMSKNPPHEAACYLVRLALEKILPSSLHVKATGPVTTRESEPEPDLSVIRGSIRDFLRKHPGPREVTLMVEVADSSLARDRGIKKRVYARAGVPEYWIVNLKDECVEVYSAPVAGKEPGYRSCKTYSKKESVPVVLDGKELGRVSVKEILP
jgi:Uma2 family endonuclease